MDHLNPEPDERESKRTPIPEADDAKIEGKALSQREVGFPASSSLRRCGGAVILLVEEEEVLRRLLEGVAKAKVAILDFERFMNEVLKYCRESDFGVFRAMRGKDYLQNKPASKL
jgi:hypothetical protein